MRTRRRPVARYLPLGGAVVVTAVLVLGCIGTAAADPVGDLTKDGCPVLYALGVQGTGQSSPNAPVSTDTGMLSEVFGPLQAEADAAHVKVARAYVPYEASFGGLDGPSNPDSQSYAQSVQGGLDTLNTMVGRIMAACPATRIAVAGYSQGAHVVSMWAKQVGTGSGSVPAAQVAGVALFGDPVRAPDSPPFPGRPGQNRPDAVPGTSGSAVHGLEQLLPASTSGEGIGPDRDQVDDFGALNGRVFIECASGDLACAAPDHAPILKAVANIAGQADSGGDPLRALWSVTQALAFTTIKTATATINQDVQGDSLSDLSITPGESLSQRVADASDPRTALDPGDVVQAALRVATIGFNSVAAVAESLLTPDTIAQVATAGLTNPVAGLAVFGEKLLGALPQLMPPETAIGLVKSAFQVVVGNISDNRDLVNTAVWAKYSDAITKHDSYGQTPITANGHSGTRYAADWFAAAARDAAATPALPAASTTTTTAEPSPSASATGGGSTGPGTSTAAPSGGAAPSGSPQYPWDAGTSGLENLPVPGPTTAPTTSAGTPAP
ncbi:cutinase family protein [Nocardia alni]|uniref:cutinase family protein n=1 Tax=Nocardia alni TaxID=2815723 RepID=UPI001C244055|nr:cutinase family protein [Nocardia alni]